MEPVDLDIEIDRAGNVKVHIRGAKGEECARWTEVLEEIVGKMREREWTAERYEPDRRVQHDQHLRGGG